MSVFGSDGRLIASTLPSAVPERPAGWQAPAPGRLAVGHPRQDPDTGQQWLDFTRALQPSEGPSAGFATVSADAEYFVSGYETQDLGHQGSLGLLGEDGVFRVRRSGEDVFFAEQADFTGLREAADGGDPAVRLGRDPWDALSRYTSARPIFGFALAVVVGLSRSEQHAAAEGRVRAYVWRSMGASVVLMGLFGLLGRLSWQLQKSRQAVLEEQVAHAGRTQYLAYHDGLTGLSNRSFFGKLLNQGVLEARRSHRPLALMFVDLDRFKLINDTLGHDAGDVLLQEVAERLKGAVRESDIVARLGGDEFVILLPDPGASPDIAAVARRILTAVRQTFVLSGHELRITKITESMLMRDIGKALEVLTALKRIGVRIAIDDFGTGYSSLSSLKQFPLDTIKINGSFIHDVVESPESAGLTEAIIAVGRTLSLTVVAEGVESEEQVDYLRDHACDESRAST